ncbi:MAG: hypothetical protein GQ570_06975 [Helicobacteraceae bacterium]|nr:hypothetical protein [Helicobacteraceae bacterium]
MKGKILEFNIQNSSGVISADNGSRYNFSSSEWKSQKSPMSNQEVDFDIDGDNAVSIYLTGSQSTEDSKTILGIISLALTFFLGFIGTFISRVVLSKESAGSALMPTLIHLVCTILILIPVVGLIVYFIATIYYMITNYKLVMNS